MEAFSYRDFIRLGHRLPVRERTAVTSQMLAGMRDSGTDALLLRQTLGPMDREVVVRDHGGREQPMLMFGSNNYLGLATHPHVKTRVAEAVAEMGVGVGGPPLLNGYSHLHRELEERLAAFEGQEAAIVFGSGYQANLGLMSALPGRRDLVLYDVHSHASLIDGLKLGGSDARAVPHSDPAALDAALATHRPNYRDVFVAIEGVYSMAGDLAPLDATAALCRRYDALLLLDDAHGTGVAGPGGHGTASLYGPEAAPDAIVGTFSKAFAVAGGFVAGSRGIIDTLRYFCRPYMFSASLAPPVVAAVLAGLDVIEQEPGIHARLMHNCDRLARGLLALGVPADPRTAIFPISVPLGVDIRSAAHEVHRRGVFANHIEHPAVPMAEQRFRLSVTAQHTDADIDRVLAVFADLMASWPHPGDLVAGDSLGDGLVDDSIPDLFEGGF